VDHWLDEVLPAPLYLRSKATPLPQDLLAALTRPEAPFARVEQTAHASLTSIRSDRTSRCWCAKSTAATRRPAAVHRPCCCAAAGDRRGLDQRTAARDLPHRPGRRCACRCSDGEFEVFVGGVWRDYSRQFGAIAISRDDYQRLGGDFQPTDLALWPLPGQEAAAVAWLAPWTVNYGLELADAADIRQLSLSIFDKSFAVTYALEAAAMLIGLFGLAVTLAASVWLRARELATLGALGFSRRMLSRAVMLEGALIAVVGLLIGLACGVAIGAILTHVINPQAFHWRMPLDIPWLVLLTGAASTLAAAVSPVTTRRARRPGCRWRRFSPAPSKDNCDAPPPLPRHSLAAAGTAARCTCRSAAVTYAPVTPGVHTGVFPRDHGAHPDFRTEWWYVTGALGHRHWPTSAFSSPSSAVGREPPKRCARPWRRARSSSPTPR
jgi:putative ABC transport system permease protein